MHTCIRSIQIMEWGAIVREAGVPALAYLKFVCIDVWVTCIQTRACRHTCTHTYRHTCMNTKLLAEAARRAHFPSKKIEAGRGARARACRPPAAIFAENRPGHANHIAQNRMEQAQPLSRVVGDGLRWGKRSGGREVWLRCTGARGGKGLRRKLSFKPPRHSNIVSCTLELKWLCKKKKTQTHDSNAKHSTASIAKQSIARQSMASEKQNSKHGKA